MTRFRLRLPDDEGAALLTVLMLVALMSGLIAVAFDRTGVALNRARVRMATHEARFDLMSAERIAVARLGDALGLPGADRTNPQLAGQTFTVPVPGGRILARLDEGGACFNLNSLAQPGPSGELITQPLAVSQMARLLELAGERGDEALRIARIAADAIDSDTTPQGGGGETSSAGPAPNRMLVDARELQALAGLEPARFQRLAPLLCALPEAALSRYNVNTLQPRHAPLIAAVMGPGVPAEAVAAALDTRPQGGFVHAQDLALHPALRPFVPRGETSIQLNSRTDWFLLDLDAQLGDAGLSERVLIDARSRPVRIVRRSYGER